VHVYRAQAADLNRQGFEPVFIPSAGGPLFAIYHRPAAGAVDRGDVIYLPPFAEEMNRSRRMAALQARALAAQGLGVLLLDPHGCGDSAGDFSAARWLLWQLDVMAAADWLGGKGRKRVALWGLRLGALLAASVAARHPSRFHRLLLWQPVASGETFLTQFLRIRVAADMAGGGEGETTRSLRRRLAAGETLEIAGYGLNPQLAMDIGGLKLEFLVRQAGLPVDWMELPTGTGTTTLLPETERVLDEWRRGEIAVSHRAVAGEPFWSAPETTVAPAWIAAGVEWAKGIAP
jgi:exosortase A-associated hydrolase 2